MIAKKISHTVSLSPIRAEIKNYSRTSFQSDLFSALTVALISVPQSIAYAIAANLPPSVGIFAAIFGTIFGAAFGSNRHLVIGPTNTMALLIQTGVSEILYTYYRDAVGVERGLIAMNILMQLTLIVGLLQMAIGFFKASKFTQFVSRSVLVGYVTGAALAILIDQLFPLFGLIERGQPRSMIERMLFFSKNFSSFHIPTAVVGVSSLIFLILFERVYKRIPSGLLVIVVSSLIVWFFGLANPSVHPQETGALHWHRVALVRDLGALDITLPRLSLPYFEFSILNSVVPIGFAIAILGILETTALVRALSSKSGQEMSTNQELFGLGVANTVSSLFGAMPSSGSFARSWINFTSGGMTRFASILSGLFCAGIILLCQKQLLMIPLAALAALLISSAPKMVKWPELFVCARSTKADTVVLCITLLSCVLFRLDIAFYIGVGLSLVLYLRQASIPSLREYFLTKEGVICSCSQDDQKLDDRVRIIHVEGEMFFAAADLLQEMLGSVVKDPKVKVVILYLKNARHIDATACLVVQQLYHYLRTSDRHLIACGLTKGNWHVFCNSGLTDEIGRENLFLNDDQKPGTSSQGAYQRAHILLEPNA